MARYNAQVKRVALIDFKGIKNSIVSDINFADSTHVDPFWRISFDFEEDFVTKLTPKEIEQRKEGLHNELKSVQKIEELAKQEPQFFRSWDAVPWGIRKYNSNENYNLYGIEKWCHYVVFHDLLYECSGPYKEDEFKALVIGEFDRERRHLERLHCIGQDASGLSVGSLRERIPEKVRIEVWRRDGGKCVRCESREKLEYDHIIPVSLGGSNTARNIELLCEKCNRSKGASIG